MTDGSAAPPEEYAAKASAQASTSAAIGSAARTASVSYTGTARGMASGFPGAVIAGAQGIIALRFRAIAARRRKAAHAYRSLRHGAHAVAALASRQVRLVGERRAAD